MNLSTDLINSFVNVTNQNGGSKESSKTLYGTASRTEDGYTVTIDGSSIPTPATTAMDIADGDRVVVLEKDHKLVITGNVTKPADQAMPTATEALSNAITALGNVDDLNESMDTGLEMVNASINLTNLALEEAQVDIGVLNTYIDINRDPTNPSVTIALNDSNKLKLLGNRVSIYSEGNETVFMANDRMVAPSAIITNLYMQTTDPITGEVIGQMGWVMRSNGHLSLKGMW